MIPVKKTDWKTIPVGSIIKANTLDGDSIYGIVKKVLYKHYSFELITLASNYTSFLFFRLVLGNIRDFEIMSVEEMPLLVGFKNTTVALASLFKGSTPQEIIDSLEYESVVWSSLHRP